ncbi:Uncharacterised protein [Klebsiella pneumoniae]|nr:Uncharacterised protein [Klebsiella pneumoniae]VGD64405.1 Uncharacterised protein [Klebsiella pneumoniae]
MYFSLIYLLIGLAMFFLLFIFGRVHCYTRFDIFLSAFLLCILWPILLIKFVFCFRIL